MIIINYGVYHLGSNNIYENVIERYKCYNVRPLAFLSDAYVFSWFWDNMYTLLLIILVLHCVNLVLIYKICEKIDIKLNGFCIIIFAFAPILVEALYWLSASTRIVFSLFLCLGSIYLILKSFEQKNKAWKLLCFYGSVLLNLMCVGYYEQTIAINLFLFMFVLIYLKKYRYIFIPITSTTWIGAWYLYFMANGNMQQRGALNLTRIFETTKECITMIFNNFEGSYNVFIKSIELGKETVFNSVVSIFIFAIIIYTIYYIYKNKCLYDENKKYIRKLLLGTILFVVPFIPFIVLDTSYIAMRNMYLPFLGFAILLECFVDLILNLLKNEMAHNIIKTGMCSLIIVFFVIANINGVNNYKKVHEIDNKIVKQILENVDENAFEEGKTVSLNYDITKIDAFKNITSQIYSIVEVDWAAMGRVQVTRKNESVGMFYINSNQAEADYVLYFDEQLNLIK